MSSLKAIFGPSPESAAGAAARVHRWGRGPDNGYSIDRSIHQLDPLAHASKTKPFTPIGRCDRKANSSIADRKMNCVIGSPTVHINTRRLTMFSCIMYGFLKYPK